ncbi:hypothetical protein DPMN_109269 [Dreissena polymorpha]|uniref:Uncharacterized protein n=1 Tax=Dreissena polymorpha TaxID=45954 RepID=A0A9D4KAT7_DREPO|nr:hypothetical protein DPMN_109269 [Dreissena polymorpha]
MGVKRLGRKRLGRKRLGGETFATPDSLQFCLLRHAFDLDHFDLTYFPPTSYTYFPDTNRLIFHSASIGLLFRFLTGLPSEVSLDYDMDLLSSEENVTEHPISVSSDGHDDYINFPQNQEEAFLYYDHYDDGCSSSLNEVHADVSIETGCEFNSESSQILSIDLFSDVTDDVTEMSASSVDIDSF